jgi:GMP synthase-like glutamine amidotransferase
MYDAHPGEGMRCIVALVKDFLQKEDIEGEYQIFDVRAKSEVPDLSFDIYISSGGPGSPLPSGEAWERKYLAWIDAVWQHNLTRSNKKYVFLICHSFQMISRHWGLGEINLRRSPSFGVMPVHRYEGGYDETLFGSLPEPFYVVDSRKYQLIRPNRARLEILGAKLLCLEKIRPHVPLERAIMGIRFSAEIFGTQFHPEADAEGMLRLFKTEEKREQVIAEHGEEKYNDMIDHLDDPDKIMLTESVVIPEFLQNAAEQLLGLIVA